MRAARALVPPDGDDRVARRLRTSRYAPSSRLVPAARSGASTHHLVSVGVLVVFLCASASDARAGSSAAPGPAAARLEVVADPGCATRDDLVGRIGARSTRIRFSEGQGGAGPALRAEIAPRRAGVVAVLLTVDVGGGAPPTARRVTAMSCEEAVDALAVMIVVLLDPAAILGPTPPPPGPPPPPPGPVAAPPPRAEAPAEPAPPDARWRFGVGAAGQGISGPAPRGMLGAAIDLRLARTRPSPGSAWSWSPSLRLGLAHHRLADWAAAGGHAAFAVDGLELDLCPLALEVWRLTGAACVMALASRVSARGFDTFVPESHDELLAVLGGAGLLGLRLARHVALQVTLSAGPPLWRDAFAFRPAVFYRVAPVVVTGGVGMGLTFP
jgi:hypothetical protein